MQKINPRNGSPMRPSRGKAKIAVLGTTLSAALLAFGVLIAGPADATQNPQPKMTQTWTPWSSPTAGHSDAWVTPARSGESVDMSCWSTGNTQLGTAKWFYIVDNVYPYTRGYVPANAVWPQVTVNHC